MRHETVTLSITPSWRERPILFSTEMVKAILEGRKNQTRRIVTPQPTGQNLKSCLCGKWLKKHFFGLLLPQIKDLPMHCPYGQIGDRLWVRETWAHNPQPTSEFLYRADGEIEGTWRPSIFMPRHASRITLEITDIRVERLNAISEADAIAEGIRPVPHKYTMWKYYGKEGEYTPNPKTSYSSLWNSINGPNAWNANPWVWAITFKNKQHDKI